MGDVDAGKPRLHKTLYAIVQGQGSSGAARSWGGPHWCLQICLGILPMSYAPLSLGNIHFVFYASLYSPEQSPWSLHSATAYCNKY